MSSIVSSDDIRSLNDVPMMVAIVSSICWCWLLVLLPCSILLHHQSRHALVVQIRGRLAGSSPHLRLSELSAENRPRPCSCHPPPNVRPTSLLAGFRFCDFYSDFADFIYASRFFWWRYIGGPFRPEPQPHITSCLVSALWRRFDVARLPSNKQFRFRFRASQHTPQRRYSRSVIFYFEGQPYIHFT